MGEKAANSSSVMPASGGGPPADSPPVLSFSGGTLHQVYDGGVPVPGEYVVEGEVPIGAIVTATANDPGGGYHIISCDWAGGSNYKSYFSSTPATIVTGSQTLGKNPDIYSPSYSFIVDDVTSYTLIVQVTYANGAHGSSTIFFSSDKPAGSLTVTQLGTQRAEDGPEGRGVALDPAIVFQATASTDAYTAGSFMFMQINNEDYGQVTDSNGNSTYIKNDIDYSAATPPGPNFNGPLQDNGDPVGYPFAWVSGGTASQGGSGWFVSSNSSVPNSSVGTPQAYDGPYTLDPDLPEKVSVADSFSMYLMYKPSINGVWIALSEVDWSWSETAEIVAGVWSGPTSQQPGEMTKTPTDDSAFPTWVSTTQEFLAYYETHPERPSPGP